MTIRKSIARRELKALRRVFFIYLPLAALLYGILYLSCIAYENRAITTISAIKPSAASLPIIYSDEYNIHFFGLEKLHPFDSAKYRRVHDILRTGPLSGKTLTPAGIPEQDMLHAAHAEAYLQELRDPATIAHVTELAFLKFFPGPLARTLVLRPMLFQAGGTIQAGSMALENGWAINLGGGFHHASSAKGEGFCPYADIAMSIHNMRAVHDIKKVMILDFDAHQGNGHERDFIDDENVYIADIYNSAIYPGDLYAEKGIDLNKPIAPLTQTASYLRTVDQTLVKAFSAFKPEIIYYIAGSDILAGDPLGGLSVDEGGLIARDERVFAAARQRNIPIVYLFGGGYQKSNAAVIARSLANLNEKFGLFN